MKKVSVLLSPIKRKMYGLLSLNQRQSRSILFDILAKSIIIVKRFWFHKRDQQGGYNVNKYVLELKKLSQTCKFGDNLSDMLRDRLPCGLKSEQIQKGYYLRII